MNEKKIYKEGSVPTILISPLDWGLGHATRCIPIINTLITERFRVIIAASSATANLLKKEFPCLLILSLKGYDIRYSKQRSGLFLSLLRQVPKMLMAVKAEHRWLKQMVVEHKVDVVLSDNRFGFFCTGVHNIYITHQLHIGTGHRFSDRLAQAIHYRYINKFQECWVPDHRLQEQDLGGILSHPKKKPAIPVSYLGPVSRFKKMQLKKTTDLLILLSGPEPQRTILENILLEQVRAFQGCIVFIRGLPGETQTLKQGNNQVMFHNHLPAKQLNEAIAQSHLVIARSGYSTVMDLAVMQQKAILVPTPGQTEQEYLARYMMDKGFFYAADQMHFNLAQVLTGVQRFQFAAYDVGDGSPFTAMQPFMASFGLPAGQ